MCEALLTGSTWREEAVEIVTRRVALRLPTETRAEAVEELTQAPHNARAGPVATCAAYTYRVIC